MLRSMVKIMLLTTLTAGLALPAGAQSAAPDDNAGLNLPPKLGISVVYYNQDQKYDISSLSFEFPGIDPTEVNGLDVDNSTQTLHAQIDYWVLPFLNLFGFLGTIDGYTDVNLSTLELGLPIPLDHVRINYDGTVYGLGFTLAGGWDQYFSSLTYEYTSTDLDVSTTDIKAWVATLKLGLTFEKGAVWVGTMYQSVDETDKGIFTIPYLGEIPFEVKLKAKDPWNALLGASLGMGKHWVGTVEVGAIGRTHILASLAYRF